MKQEGNKANILEIKFVYRIAFCFTGGHGHSHGPAPGHVDNDKHKTKAKKSDEKTDAKAELRQRKASENGGDKVAKEAKQTEEEEQENVKKGTHISRTVQRLTIKVGSSVVWGF